MASEKSMDFDLDAMKHEISRCVRCGTCMAVCPVYEAMGFEGGVARGKLSLISAHLDGRLSDGKIYRYFLTACLLCNRCKSSCPNEVDTAMGVQGARAMLARKGKIGRIKRFVLRRIMPRKFLVPVLFKGARLTRPVWASRVPRDSGLHVRFMLGPDGQRRKIPPIAKKFFLDGYVPSSHGQSDGPRVLLFVGCVNNYLRPQAAEAAVMVLEGLGARVEVPAGQGCCGLPAWGAGEVRGARKLAERNVDALLPDLDNPPMAITSTCASCAHMLKENVPGLLAEDEARRDRAKKLAELVVPFSVLWTRLSSTSAEGPGRTQGDGKTIITYHDPCHLSRGFGEKDAPRFLLTNLDGVQLKEMSHPCRCCGHGGSFNLAHYDLSLSLGEDKARRAVATGAQVVVTECSGCVLQLDETISRVKQGVEVITTAEAAIRFGVGKKED